MSGSMGYWHTSKMYGITLGDQRYAQGRSAIPSPTPMSHSMEQKLLLRPSNRNCCCHDPMNDIYGSSIVASIYEISDIQIESAGTNKITKEHHHHSFAHQDTLGRLFEP